MGKRGPKASGLRLIRTFIQEGETDFEIEALLWFIGTSGETKERKERVALAYTLWLEQRQQANLQELQ